MKSNVTLKSKDRVLFGVTIRQDTKNGFLSVTDLQDAYFRARIEKGWSDRRIERILATNSSAERIYFILEKQGLIKTSFCAFMEQVSKTSLIKVMKSCGAYKTSGARENKHTSCNPYIWMLLAMELNPELYATVIIWLTDNLIINRIEAGDKYNELCRAASRFKDVDYAKMGRALNYVVFNQHEKMLRNKASQQELKEIDDIQRSLAFAIDMGYIKSFNQLITEFQKLWAKKWSNTKIISQ